MEKFIKENIKIMKIITEATIKKIIPIPFNSDELQISIWIDYADKPVNLRFKKTILEENLKIGDKLKITIEKN